MGDDGIDILAGGSHADTLIGGPLMGDTIFHPQLFGESGAD